MTDSERAAILDKVRKLLVLAEDSGATAGEAAAAAAQAARILERYKLSRSELEVEEAIGMDAEIYRGRTVPWVRMLAHVVALSAGCRVYMRRTSMGKTSRVMLIGRESDTQVATYMFAYLKRQVDRLTEEARDVGEIYGPTEIANYRVGVVHTIGRRLEVVRDEVRRDCGMTTAIERVERADEKLEAFTKSLKLRTARKATMTYDHDARARGIEAGKSIDLESGKTALGGKRKELK